MYRKRHIQEKIKRLASFFKVVLITGSRQVGKSTLLQNIFPDYKVVVFDQFQDTYGVREDPDLFLHNIPGPLILDEVQYVPELLSAIKRKVDTDDTPGQYLLTGSQNLSMLASIAESMAGRVGIFHLDPFTLYEAHETFTFLPNGDPTPPTWLSCYLDNPESLLSRVTQTVPDTHLYETMWRGGLPGIMSRDNEFVRHYLDGYIKTYIERDVRMSAPSSDLSLFSRFMRITAASSAQEINYSQLGRDIGLNRLQASKWLTLLGQSYLWRELTPYGRNMIKRVSKKPKGYLTDTGLLCALQLLSSPDALAGHPLLGAVFETWGVNMIHQLIPELSLAPATYHWRTNGGAEVDLILERDGKLYPIEFKCSTQVGPYDVRGIKAFCETYPEKQIETALVIYGGTTCYRIDERTIAFPWNGLLR